MGKKVSGGTVKGEQTEHRLADSDVPFGVYKRQQARISRHRLYPMTVFYTLYALAVLFFALRSSHPLAAIIFYACGLPVWTLVEYLFHRFVLHGRFAAGKGIIRKFLHERLDPLHWEHHARPFDGRHINGELSDLLPLFFVAAPLSFIAPVYTLPILLAGVVQCYVVEEWVHHSVHFYNFRSPYFRYIKRHHFYHHSPKGIEKGYGLTNGFWDIIFKTRYPASVREALYSRKRSHAIDTYVKNTQSAASGLQT
ncbi:MAG TPA: sterol desaturase family protein [Terriglobia bacterium]|nr:sterol desaturase family protein [Terriglobia bacterium]